MKHIARQKRLPAEVTASVILLLGIASVLLLQPALEYICSHNILKGDW